MHKIAMMTHVFLPYMDQAGALRKIKELGYEAGDVSFFETVNDDDELMRGDYLENARKLRQVADEIGLPLVQAHAPFPIHKEGDPAYDKKIVEVIKKVLEMCAILGIKNCVIHPCNDWDAKENKERFFDLIYPTAERVGVIIATENMWNWDKGATHCTYAACSTPEYFRKHCEKMNRPYSKACVDLGHANMFKFDPLVSPGRMIEVLGHEYVSCLHIHDNDGVRDLHQAMFAAELDFDAVIASLRKIHYEGELVSEFIPHAKNLEQTVEACKYSLLCLKWMREQIEKE